MTRFLLRTVRDLACALLVALLAGSMAAGAQGPDEELLRNPGFNEDADGSGMPGAWSVTAQQVIWREKQYLGKDYEIVSRPGAYVLATQDVRLKPGARYTLALQCKAEEGGVAGALLMHGPDHPRREMPLLWNVHPTAQYEEYVTVFTAPDPACRLYLYNLAKKGMVAYDHVSLREGEPDHPIFTELSFKPIDRPLTEPPATPHVDWASPLAGGPVKALITLRTLRCLRQAVELAQRIDLDYDVVDTGYEGRNLISETGRQVSRRMKGSEYQVYVVASRVPEALAKAVREKVEAGAGLVVVEGFGQSAKLVAQAAWKEADASDPLRAGIPWELMPGDLLQSVQKAAVGKGRVIRLVFPMDRGRVWGLLPSDLDHSAYKARQCAHWEWWMALLARSITWAAGREGEARLSLAAAKPDAVTLRVANAPAGGRVRFGVRSSREIRFDGPMLRTLPREVPLPAGGAVTLPIPESMPAGATIVDAIALNPKGQVLSWGSFVTVRPQAARIVGLEADQPSYRAGQKVKLAFQCAASAACQAVLNARLVDPFGRVTAEQATPAKLAKGETTLSLALPIGRLLAVHHKAFVRILVGGREQDSRWVAILVPKVGPSRAAKDFVATTWAPGMAHPIEMAYYSERARDLGLNSEFAIDPYLSTEHGMLAGGYIGGEGFREEGWNAAGIRTKCLNDPAIVAAYKQRAREQAALQLPFGFFGAGITDEGFLTSRHRRFEVCFCDFCQGRFRQWLQERYAGLDALNAGWGTGYRSWDEVKGGRTEDIRGKDNYAPFVDFRSFMTDVWVDACRGITDAYHEAAPNTPVGHTNTFGADPFSGNDYWKLSTKAGFGWGQEYPEAIKAQGQKAIFDLWRSFVETPQARSDRKPAGANAASPFANYGWVGYDHRAEAAHYEPWWLALHGSRGVSYFATNAMDSARGTSWALIYPTLSDTGYGMAVKDALHDLRAGCGKLLMEYRREEPRIAILWSYPSMLVSWCESATDEPEPNEREGVDSYGTHFRCALNFRQHVNDLQLDYTYLAPEQILRGQALDRFPVLYLPFTVAASEALVAKMEEYVQAGGVLVGDLRCLRTDDHGKPFADSAPLRRLFGLERTDGKVDYGKTTVRVVDAAEGIGLRGKDLGLYCRESLRVVEGKALAQHATGEPAIVVRPLGRGLSVYLNFSLPEYGAETRELIGGILARAGIRREVVAGSPAGEAPPRCYERNTFSRGPITVHAFIRDHRRCTDSDRVRFRFGKPSHLYDVRAGHYLGQAAQVDAVVPPGDTVLYASLPYPVSGIALSAPVRAAPGSALALRAQVQTAGGTPGDHVFHVTLFRPDGKEAAAYTANVLAPAGKAQLTVPLALNDPAGKWAVRVRDVLTGASAQAPLLVRK